MKNKDQINFNYNEYLTRHLSLECKEYMGRLARGEDAEKVASSLYEEKLGYSKEQAEDAVGSIKEDLDFYHDSMQKATENKEEWIRSSLINRVDMLDSAAERSEYYFRIIVALDAYNIKNSGDEDADAKAAEYVEKRISNVPDEKELAKMENELLCEAVNKYMTTDFLTREIEDVLNTVEDASDEDLPLVALRYGRESEGVKLILSAQACIDARELANPSHCSLHPQLVAVGI